MTYTSTTEKVYVNSMGKRFAIRAITDTVDDANQFMESHRDTALIACFGSLNIIANIYEGERNT